MRISDWSSDVCSSDLQTGGIVAGAGRENPEPARLLRHHLATQFAIAKLLVADDIDLTDLRLGPFRNLEYDIDAVLVEFHHLRFDRRGKATLTAIQFEDRQSVV